MFGYIRILKDELKVKEYYCFRAYYCGLCKAIKRRYGFAARFSLSYDVTFLALLLCSLFEEQTAVCQQSCVANPLARRPVAEGNAFLDFAADVNVLMSYFKLRDDWQDDHSIKALLLMPLFRPGRLKKRQAGLFQEISDHLSRLSDLEAQNCPVPDEVANEFGKVMESVFFWPNGDESTNRILRHLGYALGRFIYLLDAYQDREEDLKKKDYNPYNIKYPSMSEEEKEQVKLSLTYTLSELSNSYALLALRQNRPILDNIIYLGLPDSLDRVFAGRFQKPRRKTKENSL